MPNMLLLATVTLTLHISWAHGQEITCDPPRFENGGYTPDRAVYKLEEVITYHCKNGFHPSTRGIKAKCTDKGWEPPPRCSLQPCDLPEIKHGVLYSEDSYRSYFPVSLGQWFYYSCDDGYATPTQKQWYYITCTTGGWSPEIPCHKKCALSHLEHKHFPHKEESYIEGQSIEVDCDPGYSLVNQQSAVMCTENGWDPPPRCIKHCGMPLFENARAIITGKPFKLNDTLDYQCLDGFENRDGKPSGSMVCGEDGWYNLPTCFNPAENCGPPPDISNGDIISIPLAVYPSSSRVEYQCQGYYELRGTKYITCRQGEWSMPPRCEEPCLISEEDMNENNIQLKGKHNTYYAKAGDVIEFTCKSGHSALTSVHSFLALCAEGEMELPRCL
ncbi:complement factor H-related protein 3-like [Saccopteryx bilineata]|uniref:complement factor H-related protein 3-like n=1 Tax=Saccopteryx bilineata TaxID=59482 RepID=UPI00338DBE2C